jgi:hypothetical protein
MYQSRSTDSAFALYVFISSCLNLGYPKKGGEL